MSPLPSHRTCLSILAALLAASGACGARSDLLPSGDPLADGPGGGGSWNTLSTAGTGGSEPPPPCASDEGPVVLASDLFLPITMVSDATSLFVGENAPDGKILRVPKAGGASQVLANAVSTTQSIAVDDNTVFYTSGGGLRTVPAAGGAEPALVYKAPGSEALALTKNDIFLAEPLGELVRLDRATLGATVLVTGPSFARRIAVLPAHVFISNEQAGLHRYDLAAGTLDLLAPELGSPRALLAFHDDVYFTVPSRIYRLQPSSKSPILLADLGMLGVHPEALAADGAHLYATLVMNGGAGPGIVVRVPLAGGEPEVIVADAGITPRGLVVDQGCLYWIDWQGGTVQRARKDPGPP